MPQTLHAPGPVDVIAVGLVERHPATGMATKDNRFRHDGMVYMPGQLVAVDERTARKAARAKQVQIIDDLPVVDWWGQPGRILQCEPGDARPLATARTDSSLRIVQGTGYDPGNAAYRFHTALNEHTVHASAFVRFLHGRNNPFACPTQYNATKDPATARALLLSADVVHCHIDARLTQNLGLPRRPRPGQVIVRHYHGTQFDSVGRQKPHDDQVPVVNAMHDDLDGYLLVGARLTLCALRPGRIQWLPITVPVNRYAAMAHRAPREGRPFRVAHSPTVTAIKGTDAFLAACKRLTKKGVPVEPVLITRKTHAEALAIRATCDATFDAFALGIQGSGLEGAAMGQPVIAGDLDVADLYRAHLGAVPYTLAPDAATLEASIERLAVDGDFYETERARVGDYVREVHDYPAVAMRYETMLLAAGARRLD